MSKNENKNESEKATKQETSLLRKISVKTVCGQVDPRELPKDDSVMPLMRVFGIVRGLKKGTTDYGEYVGFKGQFEAIDLKTQKRYISAVCFLPAQATEMIEGGYDGQNELSFGFDIGVHYDKDIAMGYSYSVTAKKKVAENDALKLIERQLD